MRVLCSYFCLWQRLFVIDSSSAASCMQWRHAQNPLLTFAILLQTCWRVNKSVTVWQQVVIMEFGKRHNTTNTTDFARANLLWTCYGETGVMNFCLNTPIGGPWTNYMKGSIPNFELTDKICYGHARGPLDPGDTCHLRSIVGLIVCSIQYTVVVGCTI